MKKLLSIFFFISPYLLIAQVQIVYEDSDLIVQLDSTQITPTGFQTNSMGIRRKSTTSGIKYPQKLIVNFKLNVQLTSPQCREKFLFEYQKNLPYIELNGCQLIEKSGKIVVYNRGILKTDSLAFFVTDNWNNNEETYYMISLPKHLLFLTCLDKKRGMSGYLKYILENRLTITYK